MVTGGVLPGLVAVPWGVAVRPFGRTVDPLPHASMSEHKWTEGIRRRGRSMERGMEHLAHCIGADFSLSVCSRILLCQR